MRQEEFDQQFEGSAARCARVWNTLHADAPWGPAIPLGEKARREAEAERQAKDCERLAENYPTSGARQEAWKERLLGSARQLAADCLGFNRPGVELLFTRPALDASEHLLREAKAFDPGLTEEDLLQAIRNLWVVQALQIKLGAPVALSPATFAYSMLYPCTDNFLDNPKLSAAAKLELGRWLGHRLEHGPDAGGVGLLIGLSRYSPANSPARCRGERGSLDWHANQIDELIALIEGCCPRATRPGVYFSLRAIHQAQLSSLAQQPPFAPPDREELLRITVAKGGSSVLVDAYLVKETLTEPEAEFAFAYGVLLQLMDDLQDLRSDAANGHATLVTQTAAAGEFEALIKKLWAFTRAVLSASSWREEAGSVPLRSLMEENCRLLLLHCAATNRERLSDAFLRELESASPFRLEYLATREDSLRGQYKRIVKLWRCRSAGSARFKGKLLSVPAC